MAFDANNRNGRSVAFCYYWSGRDLLEIGSPQPLRADCIRFACTLLFDAARAT